MARDIGPSPARVSRDSGATRHLFTTFGPAMQNPFLDFIGIIGILSVFVTGISGAFIYADYSISSQSVVNAINKQCGTQYERIDYLRVGAETMRDLCRIKQQRVKLED